MDREGKEKMTDFVELLRKFMKEKKSVSLSYGEYGSIASMGHITFVSPDGSYIGFLEEDMEEETIIQVLQITAVENGI
jgi:hypothetical protein